LLKDFTRLEAFLLAVLNMSDGDLDLDAELSKLNSLTEAT